MSAMCISVSVQLLLKLIDAGLIMQQHNTELLVEMVRQQFKKHKHEIDLDKIQKLKDE